MISRITLANASVRPIALRRCYFGPRAWHGSKTQRGYLWLALSIIAISYWLYLYMWLYRIYYFGYCAVLLITIAMLLTGRLRCAGFLRNSWPMLLFWAYLFTSAIWSVSPHSTIEGAGADLLEVAVLFMAYVWYHNTDLFTLVDYILAIFITFTGIMIVSYALKGSFINDDLGSIRTFLGICLPACIPLLLWRFAVRVWWFDGLASAAAIISSFLISSRTAIITTPISLVAMTVLLVRYYRPKANLGFLFCIAIVVAGVLVVALTFVSGSHLDVLERFNSYNLNLEIRDVGFDDVDAERRIVNYAAEKMFADHPWVGAGYMTTADVVGDLYGRHIAAHGWLGTLLGELGIIGTALFLFAMLRFFSGVRQAIRNARTRIEVTFLQASAVTLLSLLIAGLFQQVHQLPMFFTIVAWGYASRRFRTSSLSRLNMRS